MFRIQKLSGRCANGCERDSGQRSHAVPTTSARALCGATYGRTSAGWSDYDGTEITCPRCVTIVRRAEGRS